MFIWGSCPLAVRWWGSINLGRKRWRFGVPWLRVLSRGDLRRRWITIRMGNMKYPAMKMGMVLATNKVWIWDWSGKEPKNSWKRIYPHTEMNWTRKMQGAMLWKIKVMIGINLSWITYLIRFLNCITILKTSRRQSDMLRANSKRGRWPLWGRKIYWRYWLLPRSSLKVSCLLLPGSRRYSRNWIKLTWLFLKVRQGQENLLSCLKWCASTSKYSSSPK